MAEATVKVLVVLDEESAAEVRAKLCAIADEAYARAAGFVAPYYRGDGSVVMLPIAEVEKRRRAAAKVIDAARAWRDAYCAPKAERAARGLKERASELLAALRDLGSDP